MGLPTHPFLDVPLILVSGQARSGTTVLTRAIGQHPLVYSNMKESNYLYDIVWSVMRACTLHDRQIQLAVSEEAFMGEFRNALWHVLFPVSGWDEPTPPLAVSTFSSFRAAAGDFLLRFLPGVHVVNILRDGVEVVASRIQHWNIGKFDFESHCTAWAAAREMVDWGQNRGGDSFSLLYHRDFLDPQQTKRVFEDLFERLDLPFDSAPAEFVASGPVNPTKNSNESAERAADLSQRKERWHDWTDGQCQTFEKICGDVMDHYGFEIPWKRSTA